MKLELTDEEVTMLTHCIKMYDDVDNFDDVTHFDQEMKTLNGILTKIKIQKRKTATCHQCLNKFCRNVNTKIRNICDDCFVENMMKNPSIVD